MKKFMFSAIAVMAFSLGSMANTVDVELIDSTFDAESQVIWEVDCWTVAEFAEALYTYNNPNNSIGAYNAFSYAYSACAATGLCPSCLEGPTFHIY